MPQPSRWADVAMSEKRYRQLCKAAGVPRDAERWTNDDCTAFDDKARKLLYFALDHSRKKGHR